MSCAQEQQIYLYDALKADLTNQVTYNQERKRLNQFQYSNDEAELNAKYNAEEEYIDNQIDALDDKSGSEYEELMNEKKDIKNEKSEAVGKIEEASTDMENDIDLENETLETQIEAIAADLEGLKENLKTNIENFFGYFQN